METCQYILLPDGTYAALCRSMDWGQVVIILLLVALVFLSIYNTWRQQQH